MSYDAFEPSLVFDGERYAVVWADTRHGSRHDSGELYFARVSTSGERIGPSVRLTTTDGIKNRTPDLVLDTGGYALAWHSSAHGHKTKIHFVRLTAQGDMRSEPLVLTGPFYNTEPGPKLERGESGFGLAWSSAEARSDDHIDVAAVFAHLSPNGALVRRTTVFPTIEQKGGGGCLDLVFAGDRFLLLFGSDWFNTHFASIRPTGEVLSTRTIFAHDPSKTRDRVYDVAAAWTNEGAGLVVQGQDSVSFVRLSNDGKILAPPKRVFGAGASPSVAYDRSFEAVWFDNENYPDRTRLHLARLSRVGDLERPLITAGTMAERHGRAAIAVAPDQIAVAWTRKPKLTQEVVVSRFSRDGVKLEPDLVVSR